MNAANPCFNSLSTPRNPSRDMSRLATGMPGFSARHLATGIGSQGEVKTLNLNNLIQFRQSQILKIENKKSMVTKSKHASLSSALNVQLTYPVASWCCCRTYSTLYVMLHLLLRRQSLRSISIPGSRTWSNPTNSRSFEVDGWDRQKFLKSLWETVNRDKTWRSLQNFLCAVPETCNPKILVWLELFKVYSTSNDHDIEGGLNLEKVYSTEKENLPLENHPRWFRSRFNTGV